MDRGRTFGLRCAVLLALLLAAAGSPAARQNHGRALASPDRVAATLPDRVADRVLGQNTFATAGVGTTPDRFNGPAGIAIAPPGTPNAGRIVVADFFNHRVLSWPSATAYASGAPADLTLGSTGVGAATASTFNGPEAAVFDAAGTLYVADTLNHRVLAFIYPQASGASASLVLGQPDMTSSLANRGGAPAANTLNFPRGIAIGPGGAVFVADDFNHRVLRFNPPFSTGMAANLQIGQASFAGGSPNRGGEPARDTLNQPKGLAIDAAGRLYVAEYYNHRVTRFDPPHASAMAATAQYGQPDFISQIANAGGLGPISLFKPIDVAVTPDSSFLAVTDQGNVRVLGYNQPLQTAAATAVYGQPNFTSATPNNGGVSASSLNQEPLGLAIDASNGLHVADFRNHRVLAYDVAADHVVGSGTPASCSEDELRKEVAHGGGITFSCGAAPVTIRLTAPLTPASNVTLDGGAADLIRLSGGNANRLFVLTGAHTLALRNLTITEGFATSDGGAISQSAGSTLNISNVVFRDNHTSSAGSGGAIVSYGQLTISDSLFEDNSAANGGALYPRHTAGVFIRRSTFRFNQATSPTDGYGGALLAWDGPNVQIEDSTLSQNNARYGGAVYVLANTIVLFLNSTVSGNNATVEGGGIYNMGTLTFNSSTLAFNGGYGAASHGSSSFSGGNSLYANNGPANCIGTGIAPFSGLSSDATCIDVPGKNNLSLQLFALGAYGGPTQTHLPQLGSPALDTGSGCPDADQRGVNRPQGDRCDVGAVEVGGQRALIPLAQR